MTALWGRLQYVFLESETVAVRAFFGSVSLGYALFIPRVDGHFEYHLALQAIPAWVWSMAFLIHGLSVWYGIITCRATPLLYVLEGWVGSFTWVLMGILTSASQGVVGPTFVASFIAGWLLVRYPLWK